METIRCNIIKDLLPLYVDDVVSKETAQAIQEHLDRCESCQKEYELMKRELEVPSNPDVCRESVHALKAIKQKLRWKRIAISAVSVLMTMIIGISCYLAFENVGVIHDFFDPVLRTQIRDSQTEDWQTLPFPADPLDLGRSSETVDTLNFYSWFFSRKVTNDGINDSPVTMRILDESGAQVIDEFTVLPGESASLKELRRNTNYRVEVRFDSDTIFLNFY